MKLWTLAICCMGMLCAGVSAQTYPSKPVRFIVPFAPGGGNDVIARMMGQKLAERWKSPVVIDNRPGAGGNMAAETTARAAPDGYTILQINAAHAIAVSLYKNLKYDPVKDFATVSLLLSAPSMLVINPAVVNARNLAEFIALAKAQPGKLNYASSGSGGISHLALELFKFMAQIDLVHIPYGGAGPALNGLLGGQVQIMSTGPLVALPHVRTGRLRALGVSSLKRVTFMPEIPTVSESGVPGYQSSAWYGAVVPAGTPRAIVSELNAQMIRILHEPDVVQRMSSQGLEIIDSTPEQFGEFLKSEIVKWRRIVEISGARVD